MNKYRELLDRQQKEYNKLPIVYAFNNEQYIEGMHRLGLRPSDTDKVYKLGRSGGIYRREDSKLIAGTFRKFEQELAEAIAADKTGDGFIFDMILYEMGNHEYAYTGRISDVLDAIDMTAEQVNADERFCHAMKKAHNQAMLEYEEYLKERG